MASGLEAILHRPRPTAWQLFRKQPCVYLARLLFSWRKVIPLEAIVDPVSVVCVSDTHNSQPDLPDGDVLIHAGDLTQSGTFQELEATLGWLQRQPHPIKIVVAGNHDTLLGPDRANSPRRHEREQERQSLDWGDIVYLENEATTVVCPRNGRTLRIYGSPLSPRHGNWVFQYPRTEDVWNPMMQTSPDIDILVTHGPPLGHLDLQLGCVHLLRALWRIQPKLHVFGHVHEGAGVDWLRFDALQAAYERTVVERGGLANVLRVFVCYVQQRLFRPPMEAKTVLVNPSMVGGLLDDERRKAVRIVL